MNVLMETFSKKKNRATSVQPCGGLKEQDAFFFVALVSCRSIATTQGSVWSQGLQKREKEKNIEIECKYHGKTEE